jgi:hypothetical protein
MIKEIDLRAELDELISGADFGNEKKIPFVLRRSRRNSDLSAVRCTCWNRISNEGRTGCADCDGLGFLWDEVIINGFMYFVSKGNVMRSYDYSVEAGRSEKYGVGLITTYTESISDGDIVYVPKMTSSGAIIFPAIKEEEYYVVNSRKYRLDMNMVQFNAIILTRTK